MHILEWERFLLCKARAIPSDFASQLQLFFFLPFTYKISFSVGFPKVSSSLWIAIDTYIRTLNSTVRVDVGHSTGFKDPLVLLKYTQNNLQSSFCSIPISLGLNSERRGTRDAGAVFFSPLRGGKTTIGGNVVIFFHSERATGSSEKESIPIVIHFYGPKFQTGYTVPSDLITLLLLF